MAEEEPVPAVVPAKLLPADVSYDEKKMLLHKLDRLGGIIVVSSYNG
jgi:hypothetical protein